MSSTKLKEDFSNCLINFDRRVLITQLLDDYRLSYKEVNTIVENYIAEQQFKVKLEKRYLVHGFQEDNHKREIYKIVEEKNLKEWLRKLQNAESSLYSVEVAGGAKAAAQVFNPMRVAECKTTTRCKIKVSMGNDEAKSSSEAVEKKEVKQEKITHKIQESPKNATQKEESSVKKISTKTYSSNLDAKTIDKTPRKKSTNKFCSPSTAPPKKSEGEAKKVRGTIKPSTPKKLENFFKKQTEKPEKNENTKAAANISVQLFEEEEDEPDDVESSDEEEKLEALKRVIISSDVEIEEDKDKEQTTSIKRRRILDSDDEEHDPPIKQEKLDVKKEPNEQETIAETFLDEDGFVITRKPKKKATYTSNKSTTAHKSPPVTLKISPKEKKQSTLNSNKDTKTSIKPAAKTKQAGIMSFFSKK